MPAKVKSSSEAVMKLDTRAKGMFKENMQEYVDSYGSNLDPGSYRGRLSQAMLYLNKNQEPQVDFIFVVTEGDSEGKQHRDMHTMAQKGNRTVDLAMRIVAGRLQRMGVKTEGINSARVLNEKLEELTKKAPEVEWDIEDDQYRNMRNLTLIGENGQAMEGEASGEGDGAAGDEGSAASSTSATYKEGDKVVVNDPNDPDSPWDGEFVTQSNDEEAEIKQLSSGDLWIVRSEYISAGKVEKKSAAKKPAAKKK